MIVTLYYSTICITFFTHEFKAKMSVNSNLMFPVASQPQSGKRSSTFSQSSSNLNQVQLQFSLLCTGYGDLKHLNFSTLPCFHHWCLIWAWHTWSSCTHATTKIKFPSSTKTHCNFRVLTVPLPFDHIEFQSSSNVKPSTEFRSSSAQAKAEMSIVSLQSCLRPSTYFRKLH